MLNNNKKISKIKLTKYLEEHISKDFPDKKDLIEIVKIISESTIPIRGLLERGITSREIQYRMDIEEISGEQKNIYNEIQIHEDLLTHSIILKALEESNVEIAFIASEEAEPILGEGKFGITIDPVDGSSNVAVNRTVGTIVGIYYEGQVICSFYILYGIFTNLVLAIDGKVAEFILDIKPYSSTFYHYVFHGYLTLPDKEEGGIRAMGGDSTQWLEKYVQYEKLLIKNHFKDRYSGSFVGDFHAILYYGGIYSYFPSPKGKIRLYYEWLPLAFIAKTLGGEFLIIGEDQNLVEIRTIKESDLLTREKVMSIHNITCGGLLGSSKAVNWIKDKNL
jgi:fructose-1,6-bisphosphatase I